MESEAWINKCPHCGKEFEMERRRLYSKIIIRKKPKYNLKNG